ncbi:MAG: chemotaxis protein CheA [Terriglobales bacterium]
MSQFSDERGAEMRELFFETAQELLQSLNEDALKLEKLPGDAELVRSIRRIVHTLKGDAAACGFRELSNAAHELEDALAPESTSSHDRLAEIAFAAADTFGAMLAAYQRKGKLPSSAPLAKMVRELTQAPAKGENGKRLKTKDSKQKDSKQKDSKQKDSKQKSATPKKSKQKSCKKSESVKAEFAAATWTEYEELAIQNAVERGRHVYQITAGIDPHCAMPIAARQLVLNALAPLAEILGARPEAGSPGSTRCLELLLASEQSVDQLSARCRIPTVISNVAIDVIKVAEPKATKVVPAEAAGKAPAPPVPSRHPSPESGEEHATSRLNHPIPAENILRVDAERIDSVLNLVGELIIGRSMLQQAFTEFARHVPKEALRGRFSDAIAFQSRVLSDLQRSVMKIRMVPVEQLFRRFPRMVRDVAKQCDKDVTLLMSGQDTDLDKGLLDIVAEPLAHLVRNAVSHGIESAEERTRNGKPARGTIHLTSYHHGNQVIVEITDDGAGIDVQRVKAKALEKGLLTTEEAERLGENEILALVFQPGFSTADEITEISGRGVGLDVVQTVLHRLKGSVEVETRVGKSTTFRLKLPLTLAIIKALLFRVEQRLYAVPLNAVAEIARARESDVHQVHNHEVLQLRDRVLPLVRLGRTPGAAAHAGSGKIFVLVISIGERKLGMIVDSLDGEEELVIKALDDQTVSTDLISGASIMGDGRVVLIVNLPAIVDRHSKVRPEQGEGIVSGILLSHAERKDLPGNPGEAQV